MCLPSIATEGDEMKMAFVLVALQPNNYAAILDCRTGGWCERGHLKAPANVGNPRDHLALSNKRTRNNPGLKSETWATRGRRPMRLRRKTERRKTTLHDRPDRTTTSRLYSLLFVLLSR